MNLYSVLGVAMHASAEDIDAGYGRACEALLQTAGTRWLRRWRLRRLRLAHATLSDPERRRRYDAPLPLAEMLGRCPPGLM